MDSLPLETTDSDLASTAVLEDSPPCEDALDKNTPCFLLRADTWKAFKDSALIFSSSPENQHNLHTTNVLTCV